MRPKLTLLLLGCARVGVTSQAVRVCCRISRGSSGPQSKCVHRLLHHKFSLCFCVVAALAARSGNWRNILINLSLPRPDKASCSLPLQHLGLHIML